jgi:hypothetical protein
MTEQLAQQMTPDEPATGTDQATTPQESPQETPQQAGEPLFEPQQGQDFQRQWSDVQSRFVDDPRGAVQEADALVAEVVRTLVEGFAGRRSSLEKEWDRDEQPDTEELRVVFQRYRSFFTRLLAA